MFLQDFEDIDVGFYLGTITGDGTKEACPKYVLLILLILPWRQIC
jgi:hypothetical protein